MTERKTFKIKRFGTETLIAITYNVVDKNEIDNVKYWLAEEHLNDYLVLSDLWNISRYLIKAHLTENDIKDQYREMFSDKLKYEYEIITETFNTIQLANMRKPQRNLQLVERDFIEQQMQKIIEGKI